MTDGRFGPNTAQIEALIRQAEQMTAEQAERLADAWDYDAWTAAASAAWDAARDAYAAAYAARLADAWDYDAWDYAAWAHWAVAYAARAHWAVAYAARAAALALVVVDLVGQHGLTQEHIDTLLQPWIDVMGDPREAVDA